MRPIRVCGQSNLLIDARSTRRQMPPLSRSDHASSWQLLACWHMPIIIFSCSKPNHIEYNIETCPPSPAVATDHAESFKQSPTGMARPSAIPRRCIFPPPLTRFNPSYVKHARKAYASASLATGLILGAPLACATTGM